jgi:hypothetical protein
VAQKLTLVVGRGALRASRSLRRRASTHPQLRVQLRVTDARGTVFKIVKTVTAR